MTYAEAFSKIKKKLSKADTKGFDSDFAVQITIKDSDAAGTFYAAFIGGEFSVEPYDYRDNSVAVDVFTEDFIKLVEGKTTVEKLLSGGKLDVFGDISAFEKLAGIVKPAPRKSKKEAEKPAAKKAAKKEAAKPAEKKTAKKTEKKAEAKKEAPKAEEVKSSAKTAVKKEEKAPVKKEDKKAAAKKDEKKTARSK